MTVASVSIHARAGKRFRHVENLAAAAAVRVIFRLVNYLHFEMIESHTSIPLKASLHDYHSLTAFTISSLFFARA